MILETWVDRQLIVPSTYQVKCLFQALSRRCHPMSRGVHRLRRMLWSTACHMPLIRKETSLGAWPTGRLKAKMGLDEAVSSTTEITETNKSMARVLRVYLLFKSPKTSHPSLSSTILGLLPRREALVEEAARSSAVVDVVAVINEADGVLFSG